MLLFELERSRQSAIPPDTTPPADCCRKSPYASDPIFLLLTLETRVIYFFAHYFKDMEQVIVKLLKSFPIAKSPLLLSAVLGVLATSAMAKDTSIDDQDQAKNALATKHNEPAQHFKVINSVEFENTKSFKILNYKTQEIEEIHLDSKNREIPAAEMTRILNTRAKRGFQGKLTDELANKKQGSPMEIVDVLVWTTMDEALPQYDWENAHRQGPKAVDELEQQANATSVSIHKRATRSLLEFASKQGWEVGYQAEHAPVLQIKLPAGDLNKLEARQDVTTAFVNGEVTPSSIYSRQAIDADKVWSRKMADGVTAVTGQGVSVAVVEVPATPGGTDSAIYFPHLDLADGIYANTATFGLHATMVGGIIASTGINATNTKGVAPGLPALWSGNSLTTTYTSIVAISDAAVTAGNRILNYSLGNQTNGVMDALDYYMDYLVRTHRRTVVVAAGNAGKHCAAPNYHVATPGIAWNVITTGSYDDKGTAANNDDAMSDFSCYGNPASPHGDKEKPELVAPGTAITSTVPPYTTTNTATGAIVSSCSGTACSYSDSGTSFAAPHVSGCAALLMQRKPVLTTQPEVVKAILMASAVTNIEGCGRLSSQDGAGGIECDSADDILSNSAIGTQSQIVVSSINTFPWNYYTFNANAGQTVRAVIAWSSKTAIPTPGNLPSSDELVADIDFEVISLNSSGGNCGQGCHSAWNMGGYADRWGSASYDNAYEIVEFTAPVTGSYTVRLTAKSFSQPETIGFALWKGSKERI